MDFARESGRRLPVVLAGAALAWGSALGVSGEAPRSTPDGASPPRTRTEAAPARATPEVASLDPLVRIYRASCLTCHDGDGRGASGRELYRRIPDFTDRAWQASRSDGELARSILDGKGKSMPRMRTKLGTVDVRRMVAFVRAFQGGRQHVDDDPAEPAGPRQTNVSAAVVTSQDVARRAGGRLFTRLCAACHGVDGKGDALAAGLPNLPDFTRPAWHHRRSNPQLVVSVLDGKGAGMPPFRDKVSREQVRALVAFVRAFVPQSAPASEVPSDDDFEPRFQRLEKEFTDLGRRIQALREQPRRGF